MGYVTDNPVLNGRSVVVICPAGELVKLSLYKVVHQTQTKTDMIGFI